jgi:hypothetical protein
MMSGDTDYFEVGHVQALRLYEKYKQLVAAGEFHDKVHSAMIPCLGLLGSSS